ncbi:MAG TPA: hypothetical protein PK313_01670 [Myxococcota bacterium]|nr:hypothetical protein [Myxococcota bacterium]
MDVSELLAALEENPQDGTAFEKALTAWIDAGDNEILEQRWRPCRARSWAARRPRRS